MGTWVNGVVRNFKLSILSCPPRSPLVMNTSGFKCLVHIQWLESVSWACHWYQQTIFSSEQICIYLETPHSACMQRDGWKTQWGVRPDLFFTAPHPIKHHSGHLYSSPAFLREILNLMWVPWYMVSTFLYCKKENQHNTLLRLTFMACGTDIL